MPKFTPEYFIDEGNAFFKMMGTTGFTIRQRERAFYALGYCYLNVETSNERMQAIVTSFFEALTIDYSMRMAHIACLI
jgi:hypothetical protein